MINGNVGRFRLSIQTVNRACRFSLTSLVGEFAFEKFHSHSTVSGLIRHRSMRLSNPN